MTSDAHAAWLHACPEAPSTDAGMPQTRITRTDGTQMRLVVSGSPAPSSCRSLQLPVEAAQIDAIYPLAPDDAVGHTVLLDGEPAGEGRFAISGATLVPQPSPATPSPMPMPLHANLLASMQARSFGVEERVEVQLVDGHLEVECRAGSKPAGVILSGPWNLPQAEVALRASASGSGTFEWQVADAMRAAAESALDMSKVAASDMRQPVTMALPQRLDRATWKHFTMVCPMQQARLRIDELQLVANAAKVPPRSTWVWKAQDWQQRGDALLEWANTQHVGELFVSVPLEEGHVREAAALAAFVRQAKDEGISVWAVDGDPHMVLPSEQAATLQRAGAYAAYNASVDAPARLRGVQFDIEPYLLPGYRMAVAEWEKRYLELARMLRKMTGNMQLEFVVPYWWAGRENVLRGLSSAADSLAVMDYRTDTQEIYRFAAPFLDWAATYGKQVRIALEAGPIESETQRRYVRADKEVAGELWLVRKEDMAVLVLLKQARSSPEAQIFRFAGQRVYDGSATTFHADKQKLESLLPSLERDFGAWKGFGGMALHEFR